MKRRLVNRMPRSTDGKKWWGVWGLGSKEGNKVVDCIVEWIALNKIEAGKQQTKTNLWVGENEEALKGRKVNKQEVDES